MPDKQANKTAASENQPANPAQPASAVNAAEIEARTRAHYYPEGAPVKVKLLCDKGNGRLLGSQILGGPGSGKRIDVVATALHAGLTVAQLIDLDLAYAPPFSPVWDPVQTAARVLLGKTGGNG